MEGILIACGLLGVFLIISIIVKLYTSRKLRSMDGLGGKTTVDLNEPHGKQISLGEEPPKKQKKKNP